MGLGKTLRGTRGFCSRGSLDALGTPLGFAYYQENGTPVYYFYETNLQGDVVAIYDANGSKVVSFTYDAWGNFTANIANYTVCTTSFLAASLFRYRGYIYDYETGLYYLQSRYYDPQTGRFLNADGYVSTGQGLIGNNMYAYCGNNPIMFSDNEGKFPVLILVPLFVAGIIAVSSLASCGSNNKTTVIDVSPGEFETVEEAAIDFGKKYAQKSIDENVEYAAKIYSVTDENGKEYYTYSRVGFGHSHGVTSPNPPFGSKVKALVHTHGQYDPALGEYNYRPSDDDMYNATAHEAPSYIFAPNGGMYVYYPNGSFWRVEAWDYE